MDIPRIGHRAGERSCGHATLEGPGWPVACDRIAWFVSTDLAAAALASERDLALNDLDARVAAAARDRWPSRVAGALSVKASARAIFVSGPAKPFARRVVEFRRDDARRRRGDDALDAIAGQTLAVAAVRKAVQLAEARAARAPAFAPPATFYFYGAPGSGKTRLAEAAAERLGYPLHRLAMESYATVEDANALFGAPPGLQQGVCLVDLSLAARQPCRCRIEQPA